MISYAQKPLLYFYSVRYSHAGMMKLRGERKSVIAEGMKFGGLFSVPR